jgi:CDP-4-dehydro-6-deoxyglucose reductase
MAEIVTVAGRRFSAQEGESILDAALRNGVALEYSCRTGRCSTCKAQLRGGSTQVLHDESGLSPTQLAEGWILTCVRTARSDLVIEVEDLGDIRMFPARTHPCRIQVIERVSDDVARVVLRLPPATDFRYHPGQYIDVLAQGALRRSYSIANAPALGKEIEMHIRRVPGGAMSDYWFDRAKANDLLRLQGPLGTFFLRDVVGQDLIFLATGTGIAPVKAMLEGLRVMDPERRPVSATVYWGGRFPVDFYWNPHGVDVDHRFVRVLSRPHDGWAEARGHVQDALLSDRSNLRRSAVYACGSDLMVRDARRMLVDAGLPERRFHSDAFVASGAE